MDPLSISAAVAGFLGVAVQISGILQDCVTGVQSAPEEARNLLSEVTTLSNVLQNLVKFLRGEDLKGRSFDKGSVLHIAIEAYQNRLQQLYVKLGKLRISSSGKIAGLVERITWPLKKDGYQQTVTELQRLAQTFQFSLVLSNWSVICDSSRVPADVE
jgi:spore germination protein YaaH